VTAGVRSGIGFDWTGLNCWIIKRDPLRQFIKGGFAQLRGEFITAKDRIATVINANQEKTAANQGKMEAKIQANLTDLEAIMKMVLDEQSSIKETNFILTHELEAKAEAPRNTSNLLKAADEWCGSWSELTILKIVGW
jgi:hypothetical protein